MIICHCNALSDREIRDEILCGAVDADAVAARCGAGARCGGCRPMIQALLAETNVAIRAVAA